MTAKRVCVCRETPGSAVIMGDKPAAGKRTGETVTEDRPSAGQQAMAAAGATAGGERATIVVVDHDAGDREVLSGEPSKRYGADYSIVVCAKPEELDLRMRELIAAGTPGALVIGRVGEADRTVSLGSPRTGRATRQPRRHERTHQTRRSPWASW